MKQHATLRCTARGRRRAASIDREHEILPDEKDARVTPHLLGDRLADRLAGTSALAPPLHE